MANRYWVGGNGTWNSTNTANWSTTSGGSGGASVPGSADTAIFNASSGSGAVTVAGSQTAIGGLDITGSSVTFFFSTNTKVSGGTVTLKSGTDFSIAFQNGSTCTLVSNGGTIDNSYIYGTLSCSDAISSSAIEFGAQMNLTLAAGTTNTLSSITWPTSSVSSTLVSSSAGTRATISDASGTNYVNYIAVKDIAFTGGATWYWGTGYTDNGNNTGITTPPAGSSTANVLFFGEVA